MCNGAMLGVPILVLIYCERMRRVCHEKSEADPENEAPSFRGQTGRSRRKERFLWCISLKKSFEFIMKILNNLRLAQLPRTGSFPLDDGRTVSNPEAFAGFLLFTFSVHFQRLEFMVLEVRLHYFSPDRLSVALSAQFASIVARSVQPTFPTRCDRNRLICLFCLLSFKKYPLKSVHFVPPKPLLLNLLAQPCLHFAEFALLPRSAQQ